MPYKYKVLSNPSNNPLIIKYILNYLSNDSLVTIVFTTPLGTFCTKKTQRRAN